MAEVVRTPTFPRSKQTGVKHILWSGLDQDDSGQAVRLGKYSDKTVHIYGTFGGATVNLYGSNDPRAQDDIDAGTTFGAKTAVWTVLTDAQANAITKTSAAIEVIEENPMFVMPVVTGGDGTTALVVALVAKRAA